MWVPTVNISELGESICNMGKQTNVISQSDPSSSWINQSFYIELWKSRLIDTRIWTSRVTAGRVYYRVGTRLAYMVLVCELQYVCNRNCLIGNSFRTVSCKPCFDYSFNTVKNGKDGLKLWWDKPAAAARDLERLLSGRLGTVLITAKLTNHRDFDNSTYYWSKFAVVSTRLPDFSPLILPTMPSLANKPSKNQLRRARKKAKKDVVSAFVLIQNGVNLQRLTIMSALGTASRRSE